jgi:hypothetical protein
MTQCNTLRKELLPTQISETSDKCKGMINLKGELMNLKDLPLCCLCCLSLEGN